MFNLDIYDMMIDNFEMWFIYVNGNAMQISDCSLIDN